jgi:uncharacterized repeat protein (TIGR01451 family)
MLPRFARFTRLSIALIATLAAFAAAGGSAQAAASCPPGFTAGNKLCLATTHSPDTAFVTQSSVVTYRVVVANPGTATATKVSLQFALDPSATLVSTPPSGCSQPSSDNVITCSLGSVKPTGSSPLVFEFSATMPAVAELTSSTASVTADARASDKGNNPDDPTAESFSDAPEVVEVQVIDGQGISAVPNRVNVPLNTDADGSGATGTDTRTAKFTLFAVGFSTTANITDSVEDNFVCPQGLKCPGGGWTEAVIPGPLNDPFAPFLPPSRMDIELLYDATTLPPGFGVDKYALLHDLDYNASTTNYEQITQLCAPGPNPAPPCLRQEPILLPNGDLLVKALVQGNWRFR